MRARGLIFRFAFLISALGVAASIYSLSHHLAVHATGHTDAVCNINQTFNCDEVALSKYSEISGVPLGVFGLGYFAALMVLLFVGARGGKTAAEHLYGYAALVMVGVLTSLTLAGISVGVLGNYCLVCIVIYLLTFINAFLLWIGRGDFLPPGFNLKAAGSGVMSAAIVVALTIAGFNFLRPSIKPTSEAPTAATNPNTKEMQLSPKVEDIPITKSAYAGLGEDYRKGNDNAPVVIVEFADFQCPACRAVSGTLETLHQEFGDRTLVVFRNYPLDNSCNSSMKYPMHKFSCRAAVMARCAGQYGKFWQFHDLAFTNQESISDDQIKTWAKQVGLTGEQIASCWDNKDLLAKVQDDVQVGNRLGIDSTPTLYMNGHKVVGSRAAADLRADIDGMLH